MLCVTTPPPDVYIQWDIDLTYILLISIESNVRLIGKALLLNALEMITLHTHHMFMNKAIHWNLLPCYSKKNPCVHCQGVACMQYLHMSAKNTYLSSASNEPPAYPLAACPLMA